MEQASRLLISVALLSFAVSANSQANPQSKTLIINGKSGDATTVQINGRTYVDLETLARIANGSVGFHGSQITLTLPESGGTQAETATTDQPAPATGLSHNFMIAGIETLAEMREWGTSMAYAIQNSYGVTDSWAADFREKAASSLRQASASASTDDDRSALDLLTNEFNNVRAWSDELVEAKKRMDTAKYSTSPNALRDEPLSQKIINCGHFLGTMLGSAQFKDDPSCH